MKWWTRLTAAVTGVMLTLVVPVHAWAASNGVGDVAIEAARYRRRRGFGFFPIFGGLCCLLVVAAIVLGFVLISRNRKRRQ
jgi:ABC-type multidrug transport system permease subunit